MTEFTFKVTVTVPPGGSEDAGDYAMDLGEATSALGFDVSAFELVVARKVQPSDPKMVPSREEILAAAMPDPRDLWEREEETAYTDDRSAAAARPR